MSVKNELQNRISDQQRVVDRLTKQLALAQSKLDDMKVELEPVIAMFPKDVVEEIREVDLER